MTSSFTSTSKLYLEEPGNGDYVDTWDGPLNNNFTAIAAGSSGVTTINLASTGSTTLTNGGARPYNNLTLILQGSIGTGVTVSIPDTVGGFWIVHNQTNQVVTIQYSTPSVTAPITAGYKTVVYGDGVGNMRTIDAVGFLPLIGGTISGGLTISSTSPTITMNDTTWGNQSVHMNDGNIGFLGSGGGWILRVDNSGNTTATGNVTAYSDIRFKKDIRTIDRALGLVRRMRGVRYNRKENDQPNVGVIAQEMKEVLPEVVFSGEGDRLSVAYGNLVAVLIEAVKELADRVDELEAKG